MDETGGAGVMEYRVIPPFSYGDISVSRLIACICSSGVMVLCPETGTTLALSADCAEELQGQTLSEDLAFLLIQRGMAQHPHSRPISSFSEEIQPAFFLIDLTKDCNLCCTYCFRTPEERKKWITPEALDRICRGLISYARKHPERKLSIQAWGGEPLLELESIVRLRQRFREADLSPEIVIETNGALISAETASVLFENQIQVGISIDGIGSVHNAQRPTRGGGPSLQMVERGIEHLRSAGYRHFGTITVVTRNTLRHLPEIMDYFAHTLQLPTVKLNLMRRNEYNRDLAISLEEIPQYVDTLLRCMRGFYQEGLSIVEQNIAQRIANLLFRPNNNICNAHGCHGGYRMLSIDTEGGVYPCELSDYADYCLGQVCRGDLEEMVHTAIAEGHEYFQQRDTSACADCPWWYYCRGGCRSAAKYDTGSPLGIDQTECRFNRELYPRLVELLLAEPSFGQYLLNGAV